MSFQVEEEMILIKIMMKINIYNILKIICKKLIM